MTTIDVALKAIEKLAKYEPKEAQKLMDVLYDTFYKEWEKVLKHKNFTWLWF